MHVFQRIKQEVVTVVETLSKQGKLPENLTLDKLTVEPPKDPSHGDMATNVAMVLAKQAGCSPRELAALIIAELKEHPSIEEISLAGPGFINMRLTVAVWYDELATILEQGKRYGASRAGAGEKINVEYVSANPTGPMHIGHARGAVYGDALANVLDLAGYDVTKEYYINDAGAQIAVLAKSAYCRYLEALGEKITIPEGLYPGSYLIPVGKALAEKFGEGLKAMDEEKRIAIIKPVVIEKMMELIRRDLAEMGIFHDVFTSEHEIEQAGKVEEAVGLLEKKGLVYTGVLEPPKGKKPEDWEEREQLLFKSSDFGDDIDRPLKKSDGSWAYFSPDIAYHLDKLNRGFRKMVLVLGADHGGYVKRLKAAVAALSDNQAEVDVKLCQIVHFLEAGQPVKMSKRAGTFTTVRDVVDAVGSEVVRFIMLTRKNDAVLDFDLAAVKEQSNDNPIFYVQYAHARASSVLRHAKEECPAAVDALENVSTKDLQQLTTEDELAVLRFLAAWPRIVESAAAQHEPHRVAFYLQDVAGAFHSLWNKGRDQAVLRFIIPDNAPLTTARLALIEALRYVIQSGLNIFGIEAVEEM